MVSLRKLIRLLPLPVPGLRQSEERRAGEIRMAMLQMKQINSMFRGRLPDAMGPRAHRRIAS